MRWSRDAWKACAIRPARASRTRRRAADTIRIRRRKVISGGTVTVMTDVTEQKLAEHALIEAKQRLEEANGSVTEKNRMLEALSSKLSKYLSPQVYGSIFSGAQTVEISAKRKKLTVFFSDIAGFTETTDQLEAEELTDVLKSVIDRNVEDCARARRHHRQIHR